MPAARVAASAAVALAALAGCTSNAEPAPSPSPTVSTSPSSSPSPSATPPAMPAEAEGTSPRAAKAFVRYWVSALNFAGKSMDTSQLRSISAERCDACNGVIDKIDEVSAAGGMFSGKGWHVETVKYQPMQPAARPLLTVGVRISPQRVIERAGAEPKTFEGGNRTMNFHLAFRDEVWTVTEIEQSL